MPGKGDPPKDKQWKKGQSGNPNGRPRKIPSLDKIADEVLGDEDDKQSELYAIMRKMSKLAKNGNVNAAKVLWDRIYGLPKQSIEADQKVIVTIKREGDEG